MKVAVVGVTGLVGQKMLQILKEKDFPVSELIPVASKRSKGKKIKFNDRDVPVVTNEEAISRNPQLALFSAGSSVSEKWAEQYADAGAYVVDNSSAWRMDATKKLIVPEVNGNILEENDHIIANPNCSTIQLVMVLKPIADNFGLKRVIVSTYQSVTGSGHKGINQMLQERHQKDNAKDFFPKAYPHPIDLNVLPHIDVFQDNGYSKEEMKMILESQKILNNTRLNLSATAVRVPVKGGHSESVTIETDKDFEVSKLRTLLAQSKGIIVQDQPMENQYPLPLYSEGKDDVFVGRIRKDLFQNNCFHCWIVADNLRKGAATNAVQIATLLLKKRYL